MPISPAAIGIVFDENHSQILLIKRKDIPVWVLPGGGIEPHETDEQAVIREILEETGLHVKIARKCAEYTPINRLTALTSVFICQIEKGELMVSNETSDIQFCPLDQLPSLFFDLHQDWLRDAMTHSSFIRKPLAKMTYWHALKYFLKHPWLVCRYAITRWRSK
jgi:8-oxo-dGTP pyrophosphatase MutT (NUDIX family)